MTTLGEDLIILAVGLKPRLGPNTGNLSLTVRQALRGAELVDLTIAGRVLVAGTQIRLLDPAPVGHAALDERLSVLAGAGGMPVRSWMADLPGGFVSAYFDRMHAAGLLIEEQVRLLGLVKRPGYRLADPSRFHAVASRVHAAVIGAGDQPPQAFALAGLLYVAGMGDWFYPGAQNKGLRVRLAVLARSAGAGRGGASVSLAGNQVDPNLLFPHHPGAAQSVQDASPQDGGMREHGFPAGPGHVHAFSQAAQAAAHAATNAAVHAATQAAVAASIASAVHHHSGSGSSSSDSSPSHHHH
ncbi:MAG TPA: GPP34 family phosphoprotein [Actinocrinis sp.]|jgi:hypothetical protein